MGTVRGARKAPQPEAHPPQNKDESRCFAGGQRLVTGYGMANKAHTKAAVKAAETNPGVGGASFSTPEITTERQALAVGAMLGRFVDTGRIPRCSRGDHEADPKEPGICAWCLEPLNPALAPGLSDGEFSRRVRMLDRDQAHDALIVVMARVRDLEALLARVRCYAVVDPMGNPGALGAARMLGIERDIDDACGRDRTRERSAPGYRWR